MSNTPNTDRWDKQKFTTTILSKSATWFENSTYISPKLGGLRSYWDSRSASTKPNWYLKRRKLSCCILEFSQLGWESKPMSCLLGRETRWGQLNKCSPTLSHLKTPPLCKRETMLRGWEREETWIGIICSAWETQFKKDHHEVMLVRLVTDYSFINSFFVLLIS